MNKQRKFSGFTLVEVLVALAVVSIVLVALLGSMQSVVASATAIHDRTIASWIAVDQETEYRLSSDYPAVGRDSGELEMAGIDWVYNVEFQNISLTGEILTVIVKVATIDEPEIILGIASGTLVRPATPAGPPTGPGGARVRLNGTSPTGGYGPAGIGNVNNQFGGNGQDPLDPPQNTTTPGDVQ